MCQVTVQRLGICCCFSCNILDLHRLFKMGGYKTLLRLLLILLACSTGCPNGQFQSKPCSNFGDRMCSGKSNLSSIFLSNLFHIFYVFHWYVLVLFYTLLALIKSAYRPVVWVAVYQPPLWDTVL